MELKTNVLYFGDNLEILRAQVSNTLALRHLVLQCKEDTPCTTVSEGLRPF